MFELVLKNMFPISITTFSLSLIVFGIAFLYFIRAKDLYRKVDEYFEEEEYMDNIDSFEMNRPDVLSELSKFFGLNNYIISKKEYILPIDKDSLVIKEFGIKNDVESQHEGIVFFLTNGTKVYSVNDGTVINIDKSRIFGETIQILHKNHVVSEYDYVNTSSVRLHDEVEKGDVIGYCLKDVGLLFKFYKLVGNRKVYINFFKNSLNKNSMEQNDG